MNLKRSGIIIMIALIMARTVQLAFPQVALGIGGVAWQNWWDPYWKKNSHYSKSYGGILREGKIVHYPESWKIPTSVLYGPTLSLMLPMHFRISSTFLYGTYRGDGDGRGLSVIYPMTNVKSISIKRCESDSMISYSVAEFFHIYLGFKYAFFEYRVKDDILYTSLSFPSYGYIYEGTRKHYNEYAPGIGIGFTIPLVKRMFYLLVNASIIYNFVHYTARNNSFFATAGSGFSNANIFPEQPTGGNINKLGSNSNISFACYIESIKTTITAGFRYQFFKLLESDASESLKSQTKLWDHTYGCMFGVIVNINLSPNKNAEKADGEKPSGS